MNQDKFDLAFNGEWLARDLDLSVAMILSKALFEHYYNELDAEVTIFRQHDGVEENKEVDNG